MVRIWINFYSGQISMPLDFWYQRYCAPSFSTLITPSVVASVECADSCSECNKKDPSKCTRCADGHAPESPDESPPYTCSSVLLLNDISVV